MNAIVSGKVEKPEGSLGVFKRIYRYVVPDGTGLVEKSVAPDIAQNFTPKNYYVKFTTPSTKLYLVSLVACSSSESVAARADAAQLKILGTPIKFEYFYKYNIFVFSSGSRYASAKDYISLFDIGTLE